MLSSNPFRSPSITGPTLPTSKSVWWSLIILYGWNTYDLICDPHSILRLLALAAFFSSSLCGSLLHTGVIYSMVSAFSRFSPCVRACWHSMMIPDGMCFRLQRLFPPCLRSVTPYHLNGKIPIPGLPGLQQSPIVLSTNGYTYTEAKEVCLRALESNR